MRRLVLYVLVVLGVIVSVYGAALLLRHPYTVSPLPAGFCYFNDRPYADWALAAYAVCTCLPLLLSSCKSLQLLGIGISIGLLASLASFYLAFVSVWCFFAALASLVMAVIFRLRAPAPEEKPDAISA